MPAGTCRREGHATPAMRYFLYCRKSTEDEERQVLSLASQQEAIHRTFGAYATDQIVAVFEESKSAKTPGRPVFAEMLARLEAGEADGIASWAPDRLARNSVDGGRIIYLLDTGRLRDLKFATYTFENNPQGKFMLSIMFGQSKYYSDSLSENVRRGNRTKLERGWRPNRAPLGYKNDPATRTILPDPVHFPLVRRIFELYLYENMSPRQIGLTARDDWGFRTPRNRRSGGKPIAMATIYRMLGNAFYAGDIVWGDQTFRGAHQAIVSQAEFAQVQRLLKRTGLPRPQKHRFPFTGLIRCGTCGMRITAEIKTNKYGRRYTYYHCTRRALAGRCSEPSITSADLTHAFAEFIASLIVPRSVEEWVSARLRDEVSRMAETENLQAASRRAAITDVDMQLKELTGLRLRLMIGDEEFKAERARLAAERAGLLEADSHPRQNRFELFQNVISFSNYAVSWFKNGDPDTQRFIAEIVGSNFLLTAKKLSGEAVFPFQAYPKNAEFRALCGVVEDVREDGATAVAEENLPPTIAEVSVPSSKKVGGKSQSCTFEADCHCVAAQGARLIRRLEECSHLPATERLYQSIKMLRKRMGVEDDVDLLPPNEG